MRRDKAIKYMKLAKYQADLLSKDPNCKVGCMILAPDSLQILSLGFNGMPRGIDETKLERWERPDKYFFVEHAERNAIYNATRRGTPLENSISIITLFPCVDCARGLIQSGIHTIVTMIPDFNHHRWGSSFQCSYNMFKEANLEIIFLNDSELE